MKVVFIKDGIETISFAEVGVSVLEAAHQAGIEISGNCGGYGVCGSCAVEIDESCLNMLATPDDQESDTLDCVFNVTKRTRLSCRLILASSMDGLRVFLPQD